LKALIVAVFGIVFPCRGRKRPRMREGVVVFGFASLKFRGVKREMASISQYVAENGHTSIFLCRPWSFSASRNYLASRIKQVVPKKPMATATQGKFSFIQFSSSESRMVN